MTPSHGPKRNSRCVRKIYHNYLVEIRFWKITLTKCRIVLIPMVFYVLGSGVWRNLWNIWKRYEVIAIEEMPENSCVRNKWSKRPYVRNQSHCFFSENSKTTWKHVGEQHHDIIYRTINFYYTAVAWRC